MEALQGVAAKGGVDAADRVADLRRAHVIL